MAARSRMYRDTTCHAARRSCLRVRPDTLTDSLPAALRRGARQPRCFGGRRLLAYTASRAAPTEPTERPPSLPGLALRALRSTVSAGTREDRPLRTLPINPRITAPHVSSRSIAAQRFRIHRPPQAVRCDEGLGGTPRAHPRARPMSRYPPRASSAFGVYGCALQQATETCPAARRGVVACGFTADISTDALPAALRRGARQLR